MDSIIKNGTIVTAYEEYVAVFSIDHGNIVHIGLHLENDACKNVIDATGTLVFPGAIDSHVHLEHPFGGSFSSYDFESEIHQQKYLVYFHGKVPY